jgi:valyl-tRNA synthetase
MEISSKYDPSTVENKWYEYWKKNNFFDSTPDHRQAYTIVIPPPNVTGVLHMGHMLNNTLQDVLIRRARMLGKNACWVPGTDHASIATEAKVVALLKEKNINKKDLSREEFLKYAWEWKEKYGGIILKQLEKLGASCDWKRTKFTMDEDMSQAVLDVFIDLYNKGYIYRGVRMVNWDPQGLTAISDEEVIHKEVNSKLYFVKYRITNSAATYNPDDNTTEGEWITVATTRPETILGDTSICVNPNDPRYTHLKGKYAVVPIAQRTVPIIFDEYVDAEFGTGALKVTPAHDINDYNLGLKYNLEVINVLNDNGTLSKEAAFYIGEDRFVVRKKIVQDLDEMGFLVKTEDIKNKVGTSERTGAVIEPKLSLQWFLKMEEISKPALDNVLNGNINLIPNKFQNTYKHWMENVHDWCISRQLWWGQRIPAWYDKQGNTVVCKTIDEAYELLKNKNTAVEISEIKQDEDVLDTWFSSWLWPLTVFDANIVKNGWQNANEELKYYYPTNDLITAPEILFFWVARMAIAGFEYTNQKPFTNVYLTGIVRDKLGRKMSKSLGNSPDPIDLINMYGADGVRTGMLFCSPAGNDLLFDESTCQQGRNFCNKIWNAFRLIKGFNVDENLNQSLGNKTAIELFENRFYNELQNINSLFDKYRISEALMAVYKLVWDDFCAWYLEMIKPEYINGESKPIDTITYKKTLLIFENLMKVLHPFMPFITEEIFQYLQEPNTNKHCIVAQWPQLLEVNENSLQQFETVKEVVTQIRNYRNQKNISPKEKIDFFQLSRKDQNYCELDALVLKLAGLSAFNYTKTEIENSYKFIVKNIEFYIPLSQNINIEEEKKRLLQELEYSEGFLMSVEKKLSNDKFIANAKKEVIDSEMKKKNDALQKINSIKNTLATL